MPASVGWKQKLDQGNLHTLRGCERMPAPTGCYPRNTGKFCVRGMGLVKFEGMIDRICGTCLVSPGQF